jgi:hypothetical protein
MNSKTSVLVLNAPAARVHGFLADIANLPQWATGFCKALKRDGDRHKVVTPEGEIHFRIESDERAGTIDMFGGPDPARMAYWPSRVVALPGGSSAYIFTNFQWPGVSDEAFARQCDGLADEFAHIRRFVEEV